MKFLGPLNSSTHSFALIATAACSLFALAVAHAAMPFDSATVTRVENKVNYGQVKAGRSQTRPANPQDIVTASDFLLSESASRAELKYPDGSIVRVGQNTVFSFDANTRTLTLEKGRFIFYIPKGAGGCTIKTPSYTAAITGCQGTATLGTLYLGEGRADFNDGTTITGGQFHNAQTGATGFGTTTGGNLTQFGGPIGGAGGTGGAGPFTGSSTLMGAYPDTDKPGVTGPENPTNSASQVDHRNTDADKSKTTTKVTGSNTSDSGNKTNMPY